MRINCREMERVGTVSDLYPQQSIKTSSHVWIIQKNIYTLL